MTAEEMKAEAQQPFTVEGVDITPKQDEGILKLIKTEGSGDEAPMIGDKVSVHYTGWLLDRSKFDSSRDRADKFTFDLGKGYNLIGKCTTYSEGYQGRKTKLSEERNRFFLWITLLR